MSFATEVDKSVSKPRVLVEFDISRLNVEWVNNGAGIWAVNALNLYDWVDDTLLEEGFSAQGFGAIGSVTVEGIRFTKVSALGNLDLPKEFYYDPSDRMLWCIFQNYDEPSLHTIFIGVVYGYSFTEFTPVGASQLYEGRLAGVPSISLSRDPLFFGRIAFGGGSIDLINQDGEFDAFARDNNIYGNEARILLGYDGLDYDDYQRLYTGYIENVDIGEERISVQVADRRKQLTKPIIYVASAENPLTSIKNILVAEFDAEDSADYFDASAWTVATDAVAADGHVVTTNMQEEDSAIKIIESLALAAPGVFFITADNRYSFRVYDPSATASSIIFGDDILNVKTVRYAPSEVISSIKVGYARDWVTGGTQYTYKRYTSAETSVYNTYKVYRERSFDTFLATETDADTWAQKIYPRFTDVHATVAVEVPMKHYSLGIAETVDAEINRPQQTMLGTVGTEIQSIEWRLSGVPTMLFGLRFV